MGRGGGIGEAVGIAALYYGLAHGRMGVVAVPAFLLAVGEGPLTLVSVIAALYPAVTVAMAAVLLRERIGRVQAVGLELAVVAVVLVTVGR